MSNSFRFLAALMLAAAILVSLAPRSASAQDGAGNDADKTIDEVTDGLLKIDGFVPLYYDEKKGKMYLEASRFGKEFLYQVSLPTGIGSNPIGLDRGQLGDTRVVYFERAGNKVLLVQPNYGFRALSDNPAERRAVEESFAKSVIWGFEIAAESDGRLLLEATKFLIREAHGVIQRLKDTGQGSYSLDESRSAFYMPRTKGFPRNTEVEVTLTVTTKGEMGRLIRQIAPAAEAVTFRERHSFVELPEAGYAPREFDPRVGVIPMSFYDYATDISENLEKRWIIRHRLHKKDPSAAVSDPVEPIVYYVDNGAPPVIRDALIDGAAWWNQAFEAAGFSNAFQVKVLPPDADPQDIRYNVINWVHRSTRGWAYGNSVVDPRTGEIIKGDVTLDSQRARQDFLIATGLAPQYAVDPNRACDFGTLPDIDYLLPAQASTNAAELAAARIRQLSAHEVGHTLGFAHNFAASTYGRASVMDYPAPMIRIADGRLDFSNAYAVGIGAYDKFATEYAYAVFPDGTDEGRALAQIVDRGIRNAMLFVSDSDARPAGAAHPLANLWDNGADPVAGLAHELEVRRIGIRDFGLANLEQGDPLSELENKFLPLYLHHRYQLAAAVKSVGGVHYTYAVREGGAAMPARVFEVVPADRQRAALNAVLAGLKTEELAIPAKILRIIPPTAYGYWSGRSELFDKRTSPVFDPIGAAEIAADVVVRALLERNRAARLMDLNAMDPANPDLREVISSLMDATWNKAYSQDAYLASVEIAVENVVVDRLMDLAADDRARHSVRAEASEALRSLLSDLKGREVSERSKAHVRMTVEDIERFLARPDSPRRRTNPLPEPPGDPIGNQ